MTNSILNIWCSLSFKHFRLFEGFREFAEKAFCLFLLVDLCLHLTLHTAYQIVSCRYYYIHVWMHHQRWSRTWVLIWPHVCSSPSWPHCRLALLTLACVKHNSPRHSWIQLICWWQTTCISFAAGPPFQLHGWVLMWECIWDAACQLQSVLAGCRHSPLNPLQNCSSIADIREF